MQELDDVIASVPSLHFANTLQVAESLLWLYKGWDAIRKCYIDLKLTRVKTSKDDEEGGGDFYGLTNVCMESQNE